MSRKAGDIGHGVIGTNEETKRTKRLRELREIESNMTSSQYPEPSTNDHYYKSDS